MSNPDAANSPNPAFEADLRDQSTPSAMMTLLAMLARGEVLGPDLTDFMLTNATASGLVQISPSVYQFTATPSARCDASEPRGDTGARRQVNYGVGRRSLSRSFNLESTADSSGTVSTVKISPVSRPWA